MTIILSVFNVFSTCVHHNICSPMNMNRLAKTGCTVICKLSGRNLGNIWLDATDSETEGTFRWQATNEVMTYMNWNPGEPNDPGTEDCAQLYVSTGRWNDLPCEISGSLVCEIEY